MKVLLFLGSLLLLNHGLFAHEVNEAFFIIKKQQQHIVVEAEFPWVLRNALTTFDPNLENATDKKAFENAFIQYIKANLILIDTDGTPLPFVGFKEIDKSKHAHQNDFILTFKGESVAEITNTLMFNIYDHQINYLTLQLADEESSYSTEKGTPTIKIGAEKNANIISAAGVIVLLIVLGFMLLKSKAQPIHLQN